MRRVRFAIRALCLATGLAAVLGLATCSPADRTQPACPPAADPVARLEGLPFSRFVDEAFLLIVSRSPQAVTYHGLAGRLGVRNDALDDYSSAYSEQTATLIRALERQSTIYDRNKLSWDEQITFDAWMDYLERVKRSLVLSNALLLAWYLDELCVDLRLALSVYHPFRTTSDVLDYLARLESVDEQLDQILGALEAAVSLGECPSREALIAPVSELEALRTRDLSSHVLYRALWNNLSHIASMDVAARKDYLGQARRILTREVIPAADRFCKRLLELSTSASAVSGISEYEGGNDYYQAVIGGVLGLAVSPLRVHEMALAEVALRRDEYIRAAENLSLPADRGIYAVQGIAARNAGWIQGNRAVAERYTELIEEIRAAIAGAFHSIPSDAISVEVSNDELTTYANAALDGSRPATFLCSYFGGEQACLMRALACHEVYPGHHLQRTVARRTSLPLVRRIGNQDGFIEGWAEYAERLARELGVYREDPDGLLGELWLKLSTAVAAVIDTGMHGLGWNEDQAARYAAQVLGEPMENAHYRVKHVAAHPGESIPYFVGEMKFLELRSWAQTRLGDRFDLAEFHDAVLGVGVVPLSVLERVVRAYIDGALQRPDGEAASGGA